MLFYICRQNLAAPKTIYFSEQAQLRKLYISLTKYHGLTSIYETNQGYQTLNALRSNPGQTYSTYVVGDIFLLSLMIGTRWSNGQVFED